jgi:hypothetical protein
MTDSHFFIADTLLVQPPFWEGRPRPSFVRTAAAAAAAGLLTARPHLCLSSDQLASSTTLPLHYFYYRAAAAADAAAASMMPSIYPPAALKLETSAGLGIYHQACAWYQQGFFK